jgi:hypothetical protein
VTLTWIPCRGSAAALVGVPYFSPKFNGATRVALVSVSWADRAAIIERQREGVMLAFGNQEEEIR